MSGSPYLKALASPGALQFSAAGFLGRLQISMFGLGTVLLIASGAAVAGRVVDAGGARWGYAFAAACAAAAVLACLIGLARLAVPGTTPSGAAQT